MNSSSLPEMVDWLDRINYSPASLNSLNMIHVTGTKGKGSTCAFVQSLIRTLKPERKVGLFTSPHLKSVGERIQVDARPLTEDVFAGYFWQVWERLEVAAAEKGPLNGLIRPPYFRFLTLLAWHVFLDMKVPQQKSPGG
jgi:folylpolyglutamate synthase